MKNNRFSHVESLERRVLFSSVVAGTESLLPAENGLSRAEPQVGLHAKMFPAASPRKTYLIPTNAHVTPDYSTVNRGQAKKGSDYPVFPVIGA